MFRKNTHAILFNGPPRSGKDSIANHLARQYDAGGRLKVQRVSFGMPLRYAAFGLLGLGEYSESRYEELKDTVMPQTGVTLRKTLISISEDAAKPWYGNDYFGRVAMISVKPGVNLIIVSDTGFQEEFGVIQQMCGARNCLLVQTYRADCSFEGDSRSYINPDGSWSYRLINDLEVKDAAIEVRKRVKDLGWFAVG